MGWKWDKVFVLSYLHFLWSSVRFSQQIKKLALRRVPVGGVELRELGREGGMANNVVLREQIAAS
jgi:hypothetical protein